MRRKWHKHRFKCKKCASLDKTTVTETELRDSRKMRSKGFFMQKDGIYRPHPNCKCRWEIKENRPSLLPKTISDNIKNIYAALEYSVIQNLGSQVYGIGVDVAKIGTKIITDI